MQLILAADIFGRTPDLDEMADALTPLTADTLIVDPYDGAKMDFQNEDRAYAHFRQRVGLGRYVRSVIAAMGPAAGPTLMIGFSVGASAVWAAAAGMRAHPDIRALCFYGSQIRHHQDLVPAIAVEMFFPQAEPHFDVPALYIAMAKKNKVTCHRTEYLHGFMNRCSKNYSPEAYDIYLKEIKKRLENY